MRPAIRVVSYVRIAGEAPGASSAAIVTGATHAWIAGPVFGVLILLRFALQPPMTSPLSRSRRASMAFLGWSTLACLVWAIGVGLAHWPG